MDDDRIDFSALDPARAHPERWERAVQDVVARALEQRPTRRDPLVQQLINWLAPSLAVAMALSVAVWVGALWRGASRVEASTSVASVAGEGSDATWDLAEWARSGQLPSTETLMTLGATNGNR